MFRTPKEAINFFIERNPARQPKRNLEPEYDNNSLSHDLWAATCLAIKATLSGLTPDEKEIFRFAYFEEMNVSEIAQILSIHPTLINLSLSRMNSILREQLEIRELLLIHADRLN